MQTAYASLGTHGGNRSRHYAKKINADESQAEMDRLHVTALPHVIVYDRNGGVVGSVTGADVKKVKSYVAQAKGAE